MDLAPPPADAAPAPAPAAAPPEPEDRPPERIVGGVAALLAERLDVDALWLRIAFVLLALVGGFGVLLYGAMWLALVVGAGPGGRWARIAGGALLVVGLPFVLTRGFSFLDGPAAIVALLAGLALALWQPRRAVPTPRPVAAAAPTVEARTRRPRRQRKPPSILGRATLGLAVLVAAGGALIDQANGGRLHPEQWLGAAAIVCGVGLVVGAFAGRGLWLAVPAVLFAGAGFVGGEAAHVGVRPDRWFGDEHVYVSGDQPGGWNQKAHVLVGSVNVLIDGAPTSPVSIDARAAIGDVHITAADDVTVEVRASIDHGSVDAQGVDRTLPNGRDLVGSFDGTFTVGPAGPPDVIVTATVGRGHIHVDHYMRYAPPITATTTAAVPSDASPTMVAEGVGLTRAGDIVLGTGEAVIGADDTVLTGTATPDGRVVVLSTSLGDFRLLPGGLLVTPYGEVLDLHALRAASTPGTVAGVPTLPPVPTVAPVPTATSTIVP